MVTNNSISNIVYYVIAIATSGNVSNSYDIIKASLSIDRLVDLGLNLDIKRHSFFGSLYRRACLSVRTVMSLTISNNIIALCLSPDLDYPKKRC